MRKARRRGGWLIAGLALVGTAKLGAQAVVDRTPNLSDGWTVPVGVVQFNFLHRFEASPPPARKVTSFPNFQLTTGLPLGVNAAVDYATNSTVFTGIPNEYQLSLRRAIVRQSRHAPLDLSLTAGYNFAPQSVDGEMALGRRFGAVHLLGTVRGMTSGYDVQRSLMGVGGGAVVRVTDWLSVAGDVFDVVNPPDAVGGTTAWSAGAQLRIPYSPHSLSIHLTNTTSGTLAGLSRGVSGAHLVGFEFTIPVTLSRYFGRRAGRKPPAADPPSGIPLDTAAVVDLDIASFAFGAGAIRIRSGTRVRWTNRDQVSHSVTADEGTFDSGMLGPGASFEWTFDRPGTYTYHCMPHPFMNGRVIVES